MKKNKKMYKFWMECDNCNYCELTDNLLKCPRCHSENFFSCEASLGYESLPIHQGDCVEDLDDYNQDYYDYDDVERYYSEIAYDE
jgi:hypothetical protein